MTLRDALLAALGKDSDNLMPMDQVKDETRSMTIYLSKDDELVFGFDATQPNVADWVENFDLEPRHLPFLGDVHAGFAREAESLAHAVFGAISKYGPRRLVFSGFSQGAAHALILGLEASSMLFDVEIFGFASPRVVRWSAAKKARALAGKSYHRVNLRGDVVPHLPPFLTGYCHVGKATMLGAPLLIPDLSLHNGATYLEAVK